jgi:hypothetical protein
MGSGPEVGTGNVDGSAPFELSTWEDVRVRGGRRAVGMTHALEKDSRLK